jgi:hypothetical protein
MKPYCLSLALLVFALNPSFAEIRNGYAVGINAAFASLKVCSSALREDHHLPSFRRKALEAKVRELVKYITYYEVTENLLKQFKVISPELYHEVDTIKDRNGEITNVYIKFIPEDEASVAAWGVTRIAQAPGNANTYISEYGERSVSIKVWTVSQALLVLAHELGHVKYIVPNLAAYKKYHTENYRPCAFESNHVGHNGDDPSGKSALNFEKRFKASYSNCYFKKGVFQKDSPPVLVNKIRKNIHPW